jgi:alkylation response protein AidB-like acyl-CoA dehydrogenase
MNDSSASRAALRAWEDGKPDNFFTADTNLQYVLRRYMGDAAYHAAEAHFTQTGAACATELDAAAKTEDLIGNHPRLDRWSGIGERVEQIEFHPNHDVIGRVAWGTGLLAVQAEPGHIVEQLGHYYLLAHNGENGHMCSITCTAGAVRALQAYADEAIKAKFLPPLLDANFDTMQHAAQFLTEVQGGSDVGANSVTAQPNGDGTWRINGEKWFCSNINADQFIITARPPDAPDGTRGLGLFLVPRRLDNGETNGFYLRRLKEKLGTRTLASAELDFTDALAYPVGDLDRGFKQMVEAVLNTSRLMNAVACAAAIRRSAIEAGSYACNREAFGSPIASYPLVQETNADIVTEAYAATASCFALGHLVDKIDTGQASEGDLLTHRLLVNVNKYITSIRATDATHQAIEVLGGNGAIETFSVLPRLYRDMLVFESWEGSHNVLCLQVLRDITRYRIHEPFFRFIQAQLDTVKDARLQTDAAQVERALQECGRLLERLAAHDQRYAEAHSRRMADLFGYTAQAALLLAEAQWELDQGLPTLKPDIITHFVNRHLRPGYNPLDDDGHLPRIERLMAAV